MPGPCSGSAVGADSWFRSAVSVDPCRPLGSHGYSYATQSDRLAVAAAHLRTLYDLARDNVLFVAISRPASGAPEYRELPVEPVSAQFLRRLDARNRAGDDIYVAVNPVRPRPPTRAHPSQWGRTRAHIREPLRVQLDVDSDATDVVPALASDVLSGVVPAPHVILRSSPKKYQMLWNLPPSSADSARSAAAWTAPLAEYYSFLLARRYGADKTVYPVSTIMRVPGFYNRKLQYRDEPPLVRPCAQSPRQWFRPASSPRLAPFDFEPVQSVVRPADLRLAMEKFTPLRGAGPDDAAIAALQEKYRGDIAYSLDLHSDQARRRGMDTQLVLAGGREAIVRIVERLDAQDESLARSLASRPGAKRVSTAPGPGSSRPRGGEASVAGSGSRRRRRAVPPAARSCACLGRSRRRCARGGSGLEARKGRSTRPSACRADGSRRRVRPRPSQQASRWPGLQAPQGFSGCPARRLAGGLRRLGVDDAGSRGSLFPRRGGPGACAAPRCRTRSEAGSVWVCRQDRVACDRYVPSARRGGRRDLGSRGSRSRCRRGGRRQASWYSSAAGGASCGASVGHRLG